jgi:hypothetical protein
VTLTYIRGSVDIQNEHGSIHLARAVGNTKLEAPNCEVQVEELGGSLTASVRGDPLTATLVKGPATIVATASSVTLTDVTGPIQVTGTDTPVEVVRPGSEVTVNTTNQEISLASSGKGFRIDARTVEGEVVSDIDQLHVPEESPSHFAGVLGDGKHHYRLSTTHASIHILSASSENSSSRDDS